MILRSVSASDSKTYTTQGSGFSPKKGAAPVVTINDLALTVKSFTDTRIVGALATPAAGDYSLKIVNCQGHSTTFKVVVQPPHNVDWSPASAEKGQKKPPASTRGNPTSSARALQRMRAEVCQIKEVTLGMTVPQRLSCCVGQ